MKLKIIAYGWELVMAFGAKMETVGNQFPSCLVRRLLSMKVKTVSFGWQLTVRRGLKMAFGAKMETVGN